MNCRVSLEQLAEDLARAAEGRRSRLARHIASCGRCQRNMALLQQSECALEAAGSPEAPPEGLWERIAPRLEPRSVPRPSFLPVPGRRSFALGAATLLLAVVVLFHLHPASRNGQDEMALYAQRHHASSAVSAAQEVPRIAVSIFGDAAGIPVRLPESLPAGWKLVSLEKLTCPRGLPVAHLVYASGERRLSIFEKPAGSGPGFGLGRGRGGGYGWMGRQGQGGGGGTQRFRGRAVGTAVGGGLRFIVMGDLPPEHLQEIADRLASGRTAGTPL